jgi:hypothetical protein
VKIFKKGVYMSCGGGKGGKGCGSGKGGKGSKGGKGK